MLEDYQNKVCVVTGAASGIGKALCEKLVALGAQVYALDRNKADIEGCNLVRRTEKGRLRRRGWGLRWEKAQKGGKGTNLRGFFED